MSPQQTGVEGPAARIARVAECGHGNGANGRYRAKSQSEPTLSVQGAPQYYHPTFRLHRRGWLPIICRLAGRLVQIRLGGSEVGDTAKL